MSAGDCIPAKNVPSSTTGYSQVTVNGERRYAHVVAWESVNGPVPDGMVLDHLCHDPATCPSPGPQCPHRRCENPDHLAPTTRGENVAKGFNVMRARSHCPADHPYDASNTYVDPRGRRHCRTCTRRWIREHKARKRAARRPDAMHR